MYKLLVVLVGACGFSPADVQPDAQVGLTMVPPTTTTGCRVTDASLQLCLDFEDASLQTIAHDSAHDNDGKTHGVTLMTRAAEQAAQLAPSSSIEVADSAPYDLAGAFTFEMFLDPVSSTTVPDSLPFHKANQYGLLVLGSEVYCSANGLTTPVPQASGNLLSGRFQHVACSYDGTELRAYVEGNQISCANATPTNVAPTTEPIQIGSGFMGGIDNVHLYSRALSNVEIATLAGAMGTPAQPSECL